MKLGILILLLIAANSNSIEYLITHSNPVPISSYKDVTSPIRNPSLTAVSDESSTVKAGLHRLSAEIEGGDVYVERVHFLGGNFNVRKDLKVAGGVNFGKIEQFEFENLYSTTLNLAGSFKMFALGANIKINERNRLIANEENTELSFDFGSAYTKYFEEYLTFNHSISLGASIHNLIAMNFLDEDSLMPMIFVGVDYQLSKNEYFEVKIGYFYEKSLKRKEENFLRGYFCQAMLKDFVGLNVSQHTEKNIFPISYPHTSELSISPNIHLSWFNLNELFSGKVPKNNNFGIHYEIKNLFKKLTVYRESEILEETFSFDQKVIMHVFDIYYNF